MITKKKMEKMVNSYESDRARLSSIEPLDLVWDEQCRGWDNDYHPAIVESINVDECFVNVIDVTRDNKRFKYTYFITEQEMIDRNLLDRKDINKEKKKYKKKLGL